MSNLRRMLMSQSSQPAESPITIFAYSDGTIVEKDISGTIISNHVDNKTAVVSVLIGRNVTGIGTSTFQNCTSLTNVHIPDSVTIIGQAAFVQCSLLSDITIPNSVKSIGQSAFQKCTSLTNFKIPNSVTSIGNYAFSGCASLANMIVNPNIPPTIYASTISAATKSIRVPEESIESYKSADIWKNYKDKISAI